MVTMHLALLNADEASDLLKADVYAEHRASVKSKIENQSIVLNGETVDMFGQECETKPEKPLQPVPEVETDEEKEARLRANVTKAYDP